MFFQFINYAVIFTIFSDAFTFQGILPIDLRMSYFVVIPVLLLLVLKSAYLNKFFFFTFIIVILSSLFNILIGKDTFILLMKQVVGISITSIMFYLLIIVNKYNVKRLFRIYLNIAFLVALIGLIQEISYLLGFRGGYDFSYIIPLWKFSLSATGFLRINSIMGESASFCYAMMPAFFVSIASFSRTNFKFIKKWKSLVIILSTFFSFSTVGYIGIIFSLGLLFYNYGKIRRLIMGATAVFAFIFLLYTTVGDFRIRVDDSISVIAGETYLETTNASTFAFLSNALVAYESFKDSPVFGSGLGSHEISYNRYIGEVLDVDKVIMFLNVQDANSLFLRLLSETGLFGILLVFLFILKFRVLKKNDRSGYLWLISNAILAMFLIRLLRQGHYFIGGFFFFFWLYYFAGRSNELAKAELRKGTKIDEDTSYCS